jgi:hypothetical protein
MATNSIAKTNRGHLSMKKANQFFDELRLSPATLTMETIGEIDRALTYQPHGVARRCGLTAFMKSGTELIEMANRSREDALLVAFIAEAAKRAATAHHELAAMLEAAGMRAKTALCERTDMWSVLAEAEATYSEGDEVGHA